MYCYTPAQATWLLDGVEPASGRVELEPGPHVVACALESVDRSIGLILFAAVSDLLDEANPPSAMVERWQVVTADDGSWKYTLDRPDDDWALPSFDAGKWPSLAAAATPSLEENEPGGREGSRCVGLGAVYLGLPRPANAGQTWWRRLLGRAGSPVPSMVGGVWVRKAFVVPAPAAGPSPETSQ